MEPKKTVCRLLAGEVHLLGTVEVSLSKAPNPLLLPGAEKNEQLKTDEEEEEEFDL